MREELMKLGVDEECATLVEEYVAENYGDMEALKAENERLLEELEKCETDGGGTLKKDYEDLQAKYDGDIGALQEKLNSGARDYIVEKEILRFGGRNVTAVKALLDLQKIIVKDNKASGLEEEIERVKKEAPYLFEEKKGGYYPVSGRVKKNETDLKKKIYSGLKGENE